MRMHNNYYEAICTRYRCGTAFIGIFLSTCTNYIACI